MQLLVVSLDPGRLPRALQALAQRPPPDGVGAWLEREQPSLLVCDEGALAALAEPVLASWPTVVVRAGADGEAVGPRAVAVPHEWLGDDALCTLADLTLAMRDVLAGTYAREDCLRLSSFLSYARAIGPTGAWREGLSDRVIQAGLLRGLPFTKDQDGELLVPRFEAWNWLFRESSSFFVADKAAHRAARADFGCVPEAHRDPYPEAHLSSSSLGASTSLELGNVRLEATEACSFDVTVRVDAEGLRAHEPLRAYLPVPDDARRAPTFNHPALAAAYRPGLGFAWGATVEASARGTLTLATTVSVETEGKVLRGYAPRHAAVPRESVHTLMQRARACAPLDRAFLLYDWMMSELRYEKIRVACDCERCATQMVLREKKGYCTLFARAYVSLARSLGLEARCVTGAMFTYRLAPRRYGVSVPGEPVVGHTWAEVDIPGVGAVPVEFDPLVLKAASERNCGDTRTREHVLADFAFYRRYYFGNLDAQRVRFPEDAALVPPLLRSAKERDSLEVVPHDQLTFSLTFEVKS